MTVRFRPWGVLPWLLNKLPRVEWTLLGAIATGDRSLAAWDFMSQNGQLGFYSLLNINDIPSPYWGQDPENRIRERFDNFGEKGGDEKYIFSTNILCSYEQINNYVLNFLNNSRDNIVLDISSLPKRFFFPFVKVILNKSKAKNIIVTYTVPISYDNDKPLAVDPEPWRNLPQFGEPYPVPTKKQLIVALGYEPLGLPSLLQSDDFRGVRAKLLFPFPARPSGYLQNWEFVRTLEKDFRPNFQGPHRVNAYDVSLIYDWLLRETDNGSEYTIMAPYGTKTMSLAMAIFGSKYEEASSAYYTQPKSYNPFYSSGIKMYDINTPLIYAYGLRIEGVDQY